MTTAGVAESDIATKGSGKAGALNTARSGLASIRGWATRLGDRWPLWTPVAAGLGVAAYFALENEPPLGWSIAAAAFSIGVAAAARHWGRSRLLAALAALTAFAITGFAVGAARTHAVAAPVVPPEFGQAVVEGYVVDVVSANQERPRLLIAPVHIPGIAPEALPRRIRVTVRPGETFGPGQGVRLRAILNPPPPPAAPGAYDFARDAFFNGIGGSGFAIGAPEAVTLLEPPLAFRLATALNAARWSLARRIVQRMGPTSGGLAAAMVTGHQAWLPGGDIEAMRDAGISHIISISGVHMAIVGGFVFALVRLLIAAWPAVALRVPGKKLAAGAGLIAVWLYLALSGAPPAAERAAITASVAFLAILADRQALSLHSLSIAALAVLVLRPEAVMQPGFQMSFAATAALLALAESWPRPIREINAPWPIRMAQRVGQWFVAGALISLVAGLATAPFAIQHFNRITVWGLPANIGSEVLSTLIIMPALAVGAVAEALGGGGPPLAVAGWGLERLTELARIVSGWPQAVVLVASAPDAALTISFLGLLFICIVRTPLRWLGVAPFLAVALWPRPPAPVAWIAAGGAAVSAPLDRSAIALRPGVQTFGSELWARRRGLEPLSDEALLAGRYACARNDCRPLPAAPVKLAAWWRWIPPTPAQLQALCASAEIVVLRKGEGSGPACSGKRVLGQAALARGGAAEIFRAPSGYRVDWAQDHRGRRPWSVSPDGDEASSADDLGGQ